MHSHATQVILLLTFLEWCCILCSTNSLAENRMVNEGLRLRFYNILLYCVQGNSMPVLFHIVRYGEAFAFDQRRCRWSAVHQCNSTRTSLALRSKWISITSQRARHLVTNHNLHYFRPTLHARLHKPTNRRPNPGNLQILSRPPQQSPPCTHLC
jgi:hypothetical protein